MNENMENIPELPVKWLRVLMYIAIVSLVNSIINFLPFVPVVVSSWISWGIKVVMIVCMFQLAPANNRYKKAGIMRSVVLGCMLVTEFVFSSLILTSVISLLSVILTLAASVLSIIAVYQEYKAHSEVLVEKNSKLSGKWGNLFTWSMVVAVLVWFGSTVSSLLLLMLEKDVVRLTAIVISLFSIPRLILDLVYILYIKKTISVFEKREVV